MYFVLPSAKRNRTCLYTFPFSSHLNNSGFMMQATLFQAQFMAIYGFQKLFETLLFKLMLLINLVE